ncbi:MAG: DNA/RNA non-specific endonuclease [Bacteroidales bacterium]|nr:DNA/RNA non-specific endonuclease [Bacteroidales bacterium]
MKILSKISLTSVLVVLMAACTKPATLSLLSNQLSFENSVGEQKVSLKSNRDWTARSSVGWVTMTPASGQASDTYQQMAVSVQANEEETERTTDIIVSAGELSQTIRIVQKGKPEQVEPRLTVSDFLNKPVSGSDWYELTGEIANIVNDSYGNFYIFDETGYVYVYGLTQLQKAENDKSFDKLDLKAGDKVTMMTLRSEYNKTPQAGGKTPAYFVSKEEGDYRLGRKLSSTKAGWMELPATAADDGQDLLIHYFPDGKRSYAAYYDYEHYLSSWVAYPLCQGNIGSGDRTENFPMDPLLTREQQQFNPKGFKEGNYAWGTDHMDRGHQIPSADRGDWRVNMETFYGPNITPQKNSFNGGIWVELEKKVRTWAKNAETDTLYVVTGCSVGSSTLYVLDQADKHITIPQAYYKALLRLDKEGNYSGVAFWFDHLNNTVKSIKKEVALSIDDLEKKVGVDFFVNLPADTQKSVEAQNPADQAWWWNH